MGRTERAQGRAERGRDERSSIEQEPRGVSLAGKVTNFDVYGGVQH